MKLLPPPVKALAKTAKDLRLRFQETRQHFIALARPPVLPEAVSFLDPIDQLCEEVPPRFMQSTFFLVVGLFLSMLFIATVVKVDIVVSGTGRVATDTAPIMLQAMDQAIIREMPVQAGDVVKKGQVLATLDPTFAQADVTALSTQQQSLRAQLHRLEAELNGTPYDSGTASNADEQLQRSLYDQRQAQYVSQLRVLDEETQQREANIRSTQDHRASLEKQLKIARDVEGMRSAMMEKQVGSRLNFLDAQAARMRIEQDFQDTGNRIGELEHDLQSKQAERQAFIDQWRHQILDSLVSTRADAAKVEQAMSKAALMNNLVVVTAPEDGVVLDVAKRSVGSVIKSAEPLVTMVRSDAQLIGEITINSSDIGYTRVGDPVVVKVDAFPYQRHGFIKGRLDYVGEESFSGSTAQTDGPLPQPTSEASGAFHHGRVTFTDTHLDNMPPGSRLIPGMTMTAEIKVGRRSMISYFLNPLTRVLGESIREP